LAVAAAFLLSACHLTGSFETGPEGRSMHDTDLRRLARDEQFAEALDLTDPDDRGEIGDELLRLMHRGLLLHYAGRHEESNEVLQRAEAIIDDRYTKSVSLALLSIVTSDRALAWLPTPTERLLVNYYGALNYLALGDPEDAAVEVRRLSRLLELEEDEEFEPDEAAMREVLRYFAGSVFESTGNRNDAAVSYRHVWEPGDDLADDELRPRFIDLYGEDLPDWEPPVRKQDFNTALDSIMAARADSSAALVPDGLAMYAKEQSEADSLQLPDERLAAEADSLEMSGVPDDLVADAPAAPPDSLTGPPRPAATKGGDVVVLLEHGFVAHRVERSLNVPVFPEEADGLHSSSADVRFATASCVASRAFQGRYDFSGILSESGTDWRGTSGGKCIVAGADDESDDSGRDLYLMRVAWPEMVSSGLPTDVSVRGLAIAADAGPWQLAALDSLPGVPDASEDLDPVTLSATTESIEDAGADGSEALAGPVPLFTRPGMRGSVSGAVTEEFEDRLGGILIKAVARTALKYELARGIEKEVDKKNEVLGEIAFLTANAAAALFERADTRSWHLLPDEMSIVRLRLPAGSHPLTLQVRTARGGTRLVDLGEVIVRDGSVHVLSARVWP
jgi:hypothetical protein